MRIQLRGILRFATVFTFRLHPLQIANKNAVLICHCCCLYPLSSLTRLVTALLVRLQAWRPLSTGERTTPCGHRGEKTEILREKDHFGLFKVC